MLVCFSSRASRTSNLFSWFWMALCFSGVKFSKSCSWYCYCKTVFLVSNMDINCNVFTSCLVPKLMHFKAVFMKIMMLNANLKGSKVTAFFFPPTECNRVSLWSLINWDCLFSLCWATSYYLGKHRTSSSI